jgi:hypothetical protein
MRFVLAVMLVGCLGGGSGTRPAVTPMLSELPSDPDQRNQILDQSHATSGPEKQKPLTKKERKAETSAAYGAAILGSMFSKDQNVTLGIGTDTDGDDPPPPRVLQPLEGQGEAQGSGSASPVVVEPPSGALMPWVKLK